MIFVYILPEEGELSDGFCRPPDGNPITFNNVDWFNTPDENGGDPISEDDLIEFIKGKQYYHPTVPFLVIDTHDYTRTFIIPVDD